jgi:small subunit ribosomal protein S8
MYVNDPIGDLLTRIRNGLIANHSHVSVPKSNMKERIIELLVEEGFIASFEEIEGTPYNSLKMELKYNSVTGLPVISEIKRISKPSRRLYYGVSELHPYKNGFGVYLLSTSKGVITDRTARKLNVGGELLCSIW